MIGKFQGETRWLSNFAESIVYYMERPYPTVENAYQAAKTLDKDARLIFETCTPREAKKLGYKLKLRPDWDKAKLQIMSWLNHQKYCIPEYKAKLKATGNQNLIEGNTWGDTFWGICDGVGENHLGRILMKIREELV
jgi:ribA/ribD-fused uncharacterized protein